MKPRWLFFTLFASFSVPGRFMSIFYQEHHLDETHIGFIMATSPLLAMVCAPFFCNLADRTGRREDVALITYAGFVTAFLLQIFAIPWLNLIPADYRFAFLFAISLLLSVCKSASYALVSSITISQLKQQHGHKGHERFGHERLWGAISWATVSLILGVLLDLVTARLWVIHAGCFLFGILFLWTLHRFKRENIAYQRTVQSDELADVPDEHMEGYVRETNNSSISTVAAFSRIMFSDGMVAPMFFNLIFWLAAGMSLVENLLFLFFENELHASNFLCGISVVITVVVEIPIFAKAPDLLEKFGPSMLAIIGSSSFSLRGLGYSLSSNGWVALLNEPLHGVTYGAFHTATVAYIAERSPPELEASGQSLLQVAQSLGKILGTGTGGYVLQRFGAKFLYSGAALLVLAATLAFCIVDRVSRPSIRQSSYSAFEGSPNAESSEEKVAFAAEGDECQRYGAAH